MRGNGSSRENEDHTNRCGAALISPRISTEKYRSAGARHGNASKKLSVENEELLQLKVELTKVTEESGCLQFQGGAGNTVHVDLTLVAEKSERPLRPTKFFRRCESSLKTASTTAYSAFLSEWCMFENHYKALNLSRLSKVGEKLVSHKKVRKYRLRQRVL